MGLPLDRALQILGSGGVLRAGFEVVLHVVILNLDRKTQVMPTCFGLTRSANCMQ